MIKRSIYRALKKAGVKLDHHESDLYAEKTEISEKIIANYYYKCNVETFTNTTDGKIWYDIPFAYGPWWKKAEKTVLMWAAAGIKQQ
jgi:hypothetical protein